MVKKINRKDLLTTKPPTGSMLYDKEFPEDIKKKYKEENLNEDKETSIKKRNSLHRQTKVIK
ncbi:MAG TPA: hypothetical protein P5293_05850 [Bacteroidales bacterium]|nr:hypothetical protein [Bacteroidales bacterium]